MLASVVLLPLSVGCSPEHEETVRSAWEPNGQTADSEHLDPSKVKDAPAPRISPLTHYAAGTMLERQNDLAGAVRQYEKALAAAPRMIQAYNHLGIVYQRLGQFDDAERILKQGIRLQPDSATLHNNLGFCYLQQQSYADAEDEFRAALALMPRFSRARMNLAIALAKSDRYDDAAIEFSRVVPGEVAFYNVAVICTDMHDYIQAEQALRRSLAVNPNYEPAKSRLDQVVKLAKASDEGTASEQAEHKRSQAQKIPPKPIPLAGPVPDADGE